jgi:hypothetical protein
LNIRRSVLKVRGGKSEDTAQRNPEIVPLDDYLQISGLPFKMSPEMTAETAFFGTHESSFASAERMMRKYLPTRISDTLIREVTEHVGRKVFEEDTVQKRCKQAGMRWNEAHAQEMITLKAKEDSGNWSAAVQDFSTEWEFYENNRDELVKKYCGKYAVIADGRVVAAYDDDEVAYNETVKTLPHGSFMIHRITEEEEVFQTSPLTS